MHYRAGYRFAPSQWETALLCKDVSHWLSANLESTLYYGVWLMYHKYSSGVNWKFIIIYIYLYIYVQKCTCMCIFNVYLFGVRNTSYIENIIILAKCSSPVAQEVVKMTTFVATSDEIFAKMTFPFLCALSKSCVHQVQRNSTTVLLCQFHVQPMT